MSLRQEALLVVLVATAACGGQTSGGPIEDPASAGALRAAITRPNGAMSVLAGSSIDLEAEFALGELAVSPGDASWASSVQGSLGEGSRLGGVVLDRGEHTISVSGSFDGFTASDRVVVRVGDIAVRILDPEQGDREQVGTGVDFAGGAVVAADGTTITLVSGVPGSLTERTASFTWTSSLDGVLGTSAVLTAVTTLSAGTHTITLTVADDGAGGSGATGTASVVLSVLPPNTAPTVTITAPTCPATIEAGQTLAFTATVVDPDAADAGLTGRWTESVTGIVTPGNAYTFPATAPAGKHQVSFSATDAQGERSAASCDVFVVPAGGTLADLFPPMTTINDTLPNGDSNVRFVGAAGGRTLVGTDIGLAVYDAAFALVLTPAGASYYSGVELGVSGGDVPVSFVTAGGTRALVGTSAGLALCTLGAGQLSACAEVSPAEANAAVIGGNLDTAGAIVGATDAGLFVQGYAAGAADASQERTFTDGGSNLPSNEVLDVVADGDVLYAGTAGGLCVVTDRLGAMAAPETLCAEVLDADDSVLGSDRVTSLALDGDVLWIGTDAGLVLYELSSGAMLLLDDDNGLAHENVNDVVVDAAGVVWVATDGGLSRFNPGSRTFTSFHGGDWGMAGDDHVAAVFVDGAGDKWLATNAGVVRYSGV